MTAILRILALALALYGLSCHAEDFDHDLARHPALSPEKCAEQSPDEMHEQLEAQFSRFEPGDPSRVDGIYSQGGADEFYLTYAHQLRIKTEQDYPRVNAFRQPLLESFKLCLEYLKRILPYNIGHEDFRVSARVEWLLYEGARSDYKYIPKSERESSGDYYPELIEQIGLAMGKANVNPKAQPFKSEMRPLLRKSLASLAKAEQHMTEVEKRFFRHRLLMLLMTYI